MSQSQLNHAYDANQTEIDFSELDATDSKPITTATHLAHPSPPPPFVESKRAEHSHDALPPLQAINTTTPDKIQLASTNRRTHHEVAPDNWRIRYYMNINLIQPQPQPIHSGQRSSSLPQPTAYTPPPTLSSPTHEDRARCSIEKKEPALNAYSSANSGSSSGPGTPRSSTSSASNSSRKNFSRKPNKTIVVLRSKTRSQNNTPPRPVTSILKKLHKKRMPRRNRSRSDGMLSFQVNKKSVSVSSVEDEDDNDSVSTSDSVNAIAPAVNTLHLSALSNHAGPATAPASGTHTPPAAGTLAMGHLRPGPASRLYHSSRTPPGNRRKHSQPMQHTQTLSRKSRHELQPRKHRSEPDTLSGSGSGHGRSRGQSASMAIRRSKPLSINKGHAKPRGDFDFRLPDTHSVPTAPYAFNALDPNMDNTEHLLDDEANFEME